MPFNFKLKRTKRYEVSSKYEFVVGVHMLDNSFLECSLKADSTGHDCLECIAHMMKLEDTQYFGFRYVTKKLQFRWINLDKPLKKQLDKHAQFPRLYFGVMFYVNGAHKIEDNRVRYNYFLQLKSDVMDNRISCSTEQAVRLAALYLQVDLGQYDPEQHSLDYLKELQILPKSMTKDENTMIELLKEVVQCYQNLAGLPPFIAVVYYIKHVQMFDGYGMEYYAAKDDSGKELYLGTSCSGIFARYLNRQQALSFRWSVIAHIGQNKKSVVIDTQKTSIQYYLDDTEMAKYFQQTAGFLKKFYKSYKLNPSSSLTDLSDMSSVSSSVQDYQVVSNYQYEPVDPMDPNTVPYSHNQKYMLDGHPPIHLDECPVQAHGNLDNLTPDIVAHHCMNPCGDPNQVPSNNNLPFVAQMSGPAANAMQMQQPDLTYEHRQALLPAYRPSPDYNEVMRNRMDHSIQMNATQTSLQQSVYSVPATTVLVPHHMIANLDNYTAETPQYANVVHQQDTSNMQCHQNAWYTNLVLQPTHSSPELNTTIQGMPGPDSRSEDYMQDNVFCKPPPPYPRVSSSTPDLAAQTNQLNINYSPDLVSRKNIGHVPFAVQSKLDKSMENLAAAVNEVNLSDQESQCSSVSNNTSYSLKDSEKDLEDNPFPSEVEKNNVVVRYVAPDAAPPPSKSKEVATLRESFRRMMIARSNPGCLDRLKTKAKNQTANHILEDASDEENGNIETKTNSSDSSFCREHSLTSGSEAESSSNSTEPAGQVKSNTTSSSVAFEDDHVQFDEDLVDEEDAYIMKRRSMGPLKMAAMNGLTLSRPIILSASEDESRAPKDERRRLLESKLVEGCVFAEFEQIGKKASNMDCNVGKCPENKERNRFQDVLPYDETRVKLSSSKNNPSGYINASHIKVNLGKQQWWFLATQAPLRNTAHDFWQMIWEQEVDVIAMLTALDEQDRPKCFPYWPQDSGSENKIQLGQYEIELQFSNGNWCYITSQISIRNKTSKEERQVWHMQYTDWPDHGCPEDIYGFLGFLDEVESVHRLAESEEGSGKKSPVVVHCSAGVGRTGVVLLSTIMKSCLEHNLNVDIPRVLAHLRQQRMYMVQTLGQYSFVYKTLIRYLKNTRLI